MLRAYNSPTHLGNVVLEETPEGKQPGSNFPPSLLTCKTAAAAAAAAASVVNPCTYHCRLPACYTQGRIAVHFSLPNCMQLQSRQCAIQPGATTRALIAKLLIITAQM
jgi:hypothetical protein